MPVYTTISDLVSHRIGQTEPMGSSGVRRPVTFRLDDYDLGRLDLICQELSITRQAFLYQAITSACNEAIEGIEEAYEGDIPKLARFSHSLTELATDHSAEYYVDQDDLFQGR